MPLSAVPPSLRDVCRRLSVNDETLQVLDLVGYNIGNTGATALGRSLQQNTHLRSISLSYNLISSIGAVHLLQAATNLQSIDLRHNSIGDDGTGAIVTLLMEQERRKMQQQRQRQRYRQRRRHQQHVTKCNNVDYDGDHPDDDYIDNCHLEILLLRNNYIGPTGAVHLAKALETNDTLQRLDLGSNTIGDVGAAAIAKLLKRGQAPTDLLKTSSLHRLRHLCVWSNQITAEGVIQLAHALQSNGTLEVLNLGGNDMGDVGAHALAEMLRCNGTLRRLHIANANIGRKGANDLASGLATNTVLHGIDLLHNPIGWDGAAAFLSVLRNFNRTVQQIKLDYQEKRGSMKSCCLKTSGVNAEITVLLKLNQNGRLQMTDVQLPWGLWPTILAKVSTQADLLYLILQDKPELLKRA